MWLVIKNRFILDKQKQKTEQVVKFVANKTDSLRKFYCKFGKIFEDVIHFELVSNSSTVDVYLLCLTWPKISCIDQVRTFVTHTLAKLRKRLKNSTRFLPHFAYSLNLGAIKLSFF